MSKNGNDTNTPPAPKPLDPKLAELSARVNDYGKLYGVAPAFVVMGAEDYRHLVKALSGPKAGDAALRPNVLNVDGKPLQIVLLDGWAAPPALAPVAGAQWHFLRLEL